jgi:hypothetical protein
MPTNRAFINDGDVVRPAQLLDRGLPLPGLRGRYVVEEGWCGIITEGGVFKESLPPGQHSLGKYRFGRDVKATAVDCRLQTLTVSTTQEFTIARPTLVQIDLDLAIEYRIADPRRVALEIKTPLTSLYDRVIQAARDVVVHATHDEIRTQGAGIAVATLDRLHALNLPRHLGIEVFNVLVTGIKARGTDGNALATQAMKEYTTFRDWQLDGAMTQQSQVTWAWLLRHRPEIANQLIAEHGMNARLLVEQGVLDPARLLNQPVGSSLGGQTNPSDLLGGMGTPPGFFGGGADASQNTGFGQPPQLAPGSTIQDRIREEQEYLAREPGVSVEARPRKNSQGSPDGSYAVKVILPRSSGGQITVYFVCPAGYPQAPPVSIEVDVNGQPTPFQSSIMRRWNGHYLVEIIREVKTFVG